MDIRRMVIAKWESTVHIDMLRIMKSSSSEEEHF